MGNSDSKLNFRKAVVQLTSKNQSIDPNDEFFWSQFWSENIANIQDIYALIPSSEIRALREEAPSNLASLCFKLVEKIKECSETTFITEKNRISVLNCMRLLTRILPYIFEEPEWRGFFWSDSRLNRSSERDMTKSTTADSPLAQTLLNSLINLLFIPDFTVAPHKKNFSSEDDKIKTIDSCEYIWEAGVGFSHSPPQNYHHDYNRTEILKLLLTTFSEAIYMPPLIEYHIQPNLWITYFSSFKNQHSLPLFTSLLNIVFSYDPVGYGLPYNYLMFTDSRESLVEVSCQLLCVILETNISLRVGGGGSDHIISGGDNDEENNEAAASSSNLFISYISRIHRDEDFNFILKGFCRLLNNPMTQTILPGSCKKIEFYQELLILFWKFCDYNKKFMYFVLKSSEMLNILVPILYFLIDSRADTSKIGLIHIGVFILLLLSGERNFGVRLNKPYISKIPMDIPIFSGSHADLLIIVFHRLISTTNHRLQPLYDCLMTIIVNISPYIKSMGMVASTKLIHLLEAFSSNVFLLSNSNNYYLVFFILEILNNIIQYQFDGNYNLVYTIIRKRNIFFNLLSLPVDQAAIDQIVDRRSSSIAVSSSAPAPGKKSSISYPSSSIPTSQSSERVTGSGGVSSQGVVKASVSTDYTKTMEGATPAKEAEPGTLKATLAEFPSVLNMTEKLMPSTIGSASVATNATTASPEKSNENIDYNFMQDSFERSPPRNNNNSDSLIQLKQTDIVISSTSSISSAINNETNKTDHHNSSGESNLLNTTSDNLNVSRSSGERRKATAAAAANGGVWSPTSEWVSSWKSKLPLQTIMRLLQVLVPQVEKICVDKGLTDETEILKFLQNGTLVGLLPVPHPILIRKYQPNMGTLMWFRTYMWGVVYLRNLDPPIWYDTDVKLFEIQRV